MGDDGESSRPSGARQRTLAHLQALVTAAAVVGAGSTTGCKKLLQQMKGDGAADDNGTSTDAASAGTTTDGGVVDSNATAESTLDAAAFADAGELQARIDAGAARDAGVGYRVVDPMPRPTRIPKDTTPRSKDCDPPFTVDERGVRHFKPKCL